MMSRLLVMDAAMVHTLTVPMAIVTPTRSDVSAAGRQRSDSLKKVVDFEQACGGTIGLQGNRFPRLR